MIVLENLSKIYQSNGTQTVAVDNINLHVKQGEVCVLLGPSGCGKTTTLKMVNRLVTPSYRTIRIDGKDTAEYNTINLRRNIGYVIQQIGLFPNMTIQENISIVPKMLGWSKRKIKNRVVTLLEMMGLDSGYLHRYPKELSGGQQQRIGVARALAADPPVLLMDEPFGAIDPINRQSIQDEFIKMQEQLGKTVLFVSHDIDEAIKMADKIALFRNGKIEQYDTPNNILANPATDFVRDFLGTDRTLKRLSLLQARDILDKKTPVIRAGSLSDQARQRLDQRQCHLPIVLDENNKVLGYLDLNENVVADVNQLIPISAYVHPEDDLRTVLSKLLDNKTNWLPCVSQDCGFEGYIRLSDLVQRLANGGTQ